MTVRKTYRFATVPEWVLDHPELDANAIRVYAVLDRYGSKVVPALATIAERTRTSESTVRRAIRALEAAGAVRVTVRRTDQGRQTSNEYLLAGDEPLGDPSRVGPRPTTGDTLGGATGDTDDPATGGTRSRATRNESQTNDDARRRSSSSDVPRGTSNPHADVVELAVDLIAQRPTNANLGAYVPWRRAVARNVTTEHGDAIRVALCNGDDPQAIAERIAADPRASFVHPSTLPPDDRHPDGCRCEGTGIVSWTEHGRGYARACTGDDDPGPPPQADTDDPPTVQARMDLADVIPLRRPR